MKRWLTISLLVLFVSLSLWWTPTVFAANSSFSTTLSLTYTVSRTGLTKVNHVIELTNKTPTLYVSQYGIRVSSANVKNVTVTSNGAAVTPEIVNTDSYTNIGISFPDEVVGEGKSRRIEVTYTHPDAALISGKVLEVQVPKLGKPEEYDRYTVKLITPSEFGQPTRVTPASYQTLDGGTTLVTNFTPQNGESVTALFGQQQIFDLKLRYHLENSSTNAGLAQISLPPDTAFQKLQYESLDPRPKEMARDADGNWIATYELGAQSNVVVNALAKVLITLRPSPFFTSSNPGPQYLKGQEFWETNVPSISDLAQELSSPRAIHDYVVKNYKYNYAYLENQTPRLGAANSLTNPEQGACQEFTDTFVAISRAAGIPSRRLAGYAYTQNTKLRPLSLDQDILHAWPEYFDTSKNLWIPIDPTWENTTGGVNYFDQFDLNHIVFAINGLSSSTPFPAGSYQASQKTGKDVEVSFSDTFPETVASFSLKKKPQQFSLPGKNQVVLSNETGLAWYNVALQVSSGQEPDLDADQLELLPVILPHQTVALTIPMYSEEIGFLEKRPVQLELTYTNDDRSGLAATTTNDQPETRTYQLQPLELNLAAGYFETLTSPYGLIGVGVGGTFIALGAGSLLVLGRSRQRPVRRKS